MSITRSKPSITRSKPLPSAQTDRGPRSAVSASERFDSELHANLLDQRALAKGRVLSRKNYGCPPKELWLSPERSMVVPRRNYGCPRKKYGCPQLLLLSTR